MVSSQKNLRVLAAACLAACISPFAKATEAADAGVKWGGRYALYRGSIEATLRAGGYAPTPDEMERALQGPDVMMKVCAVQGIAATGTVSKIPAIKRMLSDPEMMLRHAAISSLFDMHQRYPDVDKVISNSELAASARSFYSDALSGKGLFPGAYNLDAATLLLEVAGDPAGYPIVWKAITDSDITKRGRAIGAVQVFASVGVRDADGQEVDWVTPLAAIVRDKRAPFTARAGSLSALNGMGTDQALAALREIDETVDDLRLLNMINACSSEPRPSPVRRQRVPHHEG